MREPVGKSSKRRNGAGPSRPASAAGRSRRRKYPSSDQLMEVYERLLAAYGPRNWWPGDGDFEIVMGAILTQNTSWKNVERALTRMRESGIWSFKAVHEADLPVLADAIRPSGYYNSKARKLKEFALVVMDEFDGDANTLWSLETATLRERLLGIWGIGEETADDIVLYVAEKPSFVIDKYTRRIVDRLGWRVAGDRYADYQALFMDRLPVDAPLYNEYHALLDGHAARTCQTSPACNACCLADLCPTGQGPV
ncbi:MAG: hypothetical protein WD208_05230 [Dehalococcoidia bacterium]